MGKLVAKIGGNNVKYLVVSDSHGDRECLVDLVQQYQGKVTAMFHCGDSELAPNDPLWQEFIVVKGNCDYDPEFPESVVKKFGEDTIYMTHGHLANVRSGLTTLSLQAEAAGASIALFGHTHVLGCERHNRILFLNPGSIRLPRGPVTIKTYAIIESLEDKYEIQYFDREHQPIEKLQATFSK
jgi:putative phosphoesterase